MVHGLWTVELLGIVHSKNFESTGSWGLAAQRCEISNHHWSMCAANKLSNLFIGLGMPCYHAMTHRGTTDTDGGYDEGQRGNLLQFGCGMNVGDEEEEVGVRRV